MITHYILVNAYGVYVKEADFFLSQHGDTQDWGISWKPVTATSIEDAREQGYKIRDRDRR